MNSVSNSGAAITSIPIVLPDGLNDFAPELAITYSSSSGNGSCGYGWNLTGLSGISRIGKDFYHDADLVPVKGNSTDFFALDGNRLVATSGTYGADATTYGTEVESYQRITSYGVSSASSGASPLSFKVENKGGVQMEYGNTVDSKFSSLGGSNPATLCWQINKMTDVFGNSINYVYETVSNE